MGLITIKDIAKELSLSPSTVSRALNDSPQVSVETKRKVSELVKQYNYKPNRNAQNLVNNSTFTIGYMIPDISDSYFAYSALGVDEALRNTPYEISYFATQRSSRKVVDYLERAVEYRYSGIIITPDQWDKQLIKYLSELTIPVVSLRRKTPQGVSGIPYVDSDHTGGMSDMVDYLVSLGHQHIAYIGFQSLIGNERKLGYLSATARHSMPQYLKVNPSALHVMKRPQLGYEAAEELLKDFPQLTAMVCLDDYLALGALEYFQSKGIHVPDEISVAGFDDREVGSIYSTQITTVHLYQYEMGQHAAGMILKMIKNKEEVPPSLMLQTKLVLKNTTGPCHKK